MNRQRLQNLIVYAAVALTAALVVAQAWAGRPVTTASFVRLLVFALPLAGIYAISSSGIVVVHTTTGIFNFAQGGIGLFLAYAYWELRVNRDLPTWLALALTIGLAAPALGIFLDRLIMQKLLHQSLVTQLMVTVGLLLAFMGVTQSIWPPSQQHTMPEMFSGSSGFEIADVTITWHRLTTLVVALVLAVVLRLLLFRTRIGVAMRAVVDNRDLAALNGTRPAFVSALSWSIGCGVAAIAGILTAPETTMSVIPLTFIVLNAFAAAILGRLRSLPLTYVGALVLAVAVSFTSQFLQLGQRWAFAPLGLPSLMLFVALLLLPQASLRFARPRRVRQVERVTRPRDAVIGYVLVFVVMWWWSGTLDPTNLNRVTAGMVTALIALSLIPLTGWAGQVNLAPLAYAGIGAVAYARWGGEHGSWWAILFAVLVAIPIGAITALPAARLQGLYLALASLAFAALAEYLVFGQPFALGTASKRAARVELFGIEFDKTRPFLLLVTTVFGIVALGLVVLRRSPYGRRLIALRDSEAASATLGINVMWTKVAVFSLSAAIAAFAGAFFAMEKTTLTPDRFTTFAGLPIVLSLVVGGIACTSGALFAGVFTFVLVIVTAEYPDVTVFRQLTILGPGLAALGVLRNPAGAVVAIGEAFAPLIPWRRDAREEKRAAAARRAEPEVGEMGLTRRFESEEVTFVDKQLGVVDDLTPERRGGVRVGAP
ncbi:MAG: branched-chain amino acid ABC transporter permease [Actinomycetota bacterium]